MKKIIKSVLYFLIFALLTSKQTFAVPVSTSVPFRLVQMNPDFFTGLRITGYVDGNDETHLFDSPIMHMGEYYTTPNLQLGNFENGDHFTFRILGEFHAVSNMPGAVNIPIPFRIRFDVALTQNEQGILEGNVPNAASRLEHIHAYYPIAAHDPRITIDQDAAITFRNNLPMNRVTGLRVRQANPAAAQAAPSLYAQVL